ncbi:MAG: efflux RND transporter periplasmic adaptor subunit [Idiomarina sp.]|nr:efflux RND transporter periplasmic adaptor subunit [Idiomarina sp.]
MIKRMILMLAATGIVFGLIFGYKAIGNYFMNDFFDNMPPPSATITATEVKQDSWTESMQTVGSFVPVNGTMLTVQVAGVVTEINFQNGQAVNRGDTLLTLDTDVDIAERDRLAAALDIAEREARRLERLSESQNVSESDLQRAQSEVAQTRAALATQDALIRQKTIRAPFDGVLGIRRVNLGQYVSPGHDLVAIESFTPIFLSFNLPEHRLSSLSVGQRVRASVDAFTSEEFRGEIVAIEPRIRESTRSVEVQALFDNENAQLRPGMFARVRMDVGEARDVKVIPRTAVQFNPFGNVVYIIEEAGDDELRVQQRLIRTGQTRGDMIAVEEGLELGDRIATSGLLKLRNDTVVKINEDEALQPSTDTDPTPRNR